MPLPHPHSLFGNAPTYKGEEIGSAMRHVPVFEQGWRRYKRKNKDTGSSIKDVEDDRRRTLLKHRLQLGRSLDDFSLGVDRDEGG